MPRPTSSSDVDQRDRIEVAKNLETNFGREIADEVNIESRMQLLNDFGDHAGRETIEESHGQVCIAKIS